jgi:hypothetical protein
MRSERWELKAGSQWRERKTAERRNPAAADGDDRL